MEADWAVEIGPDLPRIDASWSGWIDLRNHPHRIDELEEVAQHPALRRALAALNAANSPILTTKCDVWTLSAAEIDADEFGSSREDAHSGFASYIDLVEYDAARFASFAVHEQRVREVAHRLRESPVRQSRVDLVLRAAARDEQSGYGITLYAAGCGADEADAHACWERALAAAIAATIATAQRPAAAGE